MKREVTINFAAFLTTALAIWLGVTGYVEWWVIILIGLSHTSLNIKFEV